MQKAKKVLSLLLSLVLLMSSLSVGLVVSAKVTVTNHNDVYVVVPETIYLTPTTSCTATVPKYYINNTFNSSSNSVTLDATASATTGKMYFKCTDATKVTASAYDPGGSLLNTYTLSGSSGYFYNTSFTLGTLKTAVSAGDSKQVKWIFTATMSDNSTETFTAYTTVYSPFMEPVGATVRTGADGTWCSGSSWISGVHGYSSTYSGGTNTPYNSLQYPRKTGLYPILGAFAKSSNGKTGPQSLHISSSSGDSYHSYTTMAYGSREKDDSLTNIMVSPTATLTVDVSRNDNLNEIPNVSVGFMITDAQDADKSYYYMADYTGYGTPVNDSNNKNNGKPNDTQTGWWSGTTGSIFFGDTGTNRGGESSYKNKDPQYNGAWNKSLSTSASSQNLILKTATRTYCDDTVGYDDYSTSIYYIKLDTTNVNKSSLRSKIAEYQKAGYQSTWISNSSYWSAYETALKNAYLYLGQPTATASQISSALSTLTSAFTNVQNSLKSNTSQALHFGYSVVLNSSGQQTGEYVVTKALTANDDGAKTFKADQKLEIAKNDYSSDGYTYTGYIKTASDVDVGGKLTISSLNTDTSVSHLRGYNVITSDDRNLSFYYLGKTVYLTVNPNGGTWNGGTSSTKLTATYLSTLTPVDPTRVGYTFTEWSVTGGDGTLASNSDGTQTYTFGASDGTIQANWEANKYTLKYDLNDGDRTGTATCTETQKTVTYDSTVGALAVPQMDAYTFDGWFTERTGGTQITASTTYKTDGDTTVYAHWTPIDYTVSYDENFGVAINNSTYNIEGGNLSSTTRTGYTFNIWDVTSENGNWTVGETLAEGASLAGKWGDVDVHAQWTPNNYTLSFDLNDGARVGASASVCDDITVTYDAKVGALPEPELTAYTFDGWYTSAEGGTQVTADTVYETAGDSTVYAHWTPVTYTASFEPNGGVEVSPIDYNIESTFVFPIDTRIGYTFEVWNSGAEGNWEDGATYIAGQTSPANMYGDVIFGASWIANQYLLTFDLNDAQYTKAECGTSTKTVIYDSAVGELPVPTRTAYTFDGWFLEDGTEVTADTVWKIADNTTLYAHWTPITYTVTYNVNNGNPLDPTEYTIEDELYLREPTRTGYTFTEYRVNTLPEVTSWKYGAYTSLNLGTGNYGDITVIARWEIKYYNITWNIVGTATSSSVKYNDTPAAPSTAYDDAMYTYVFKHWSKTADGEETAILPATEDTTYYAVYDKTPKEYTVTWLDADGNVLEARTVAYGADIPTDVEVPALTGYTAKWDTTLTTMPANDITIRPAYTPIKYTITWADEDGTVLATDAVDYNLIPSYTGEAPAKATDSMYSYTFSGWTPTVSAVKGDATYTAVYSKTPIEYTVTWVLYDINDENPSTLKTSTVGYGEAITDIPTIERVPGYAGEWKNVPETMPDHDITIEGHYRYGARIITWITDTNVSYETIAFDGEKPVFTFGTPTKKATAEYSFVFKGWSETDGGEILAELPVANGEDMTFYAVYEPKAQEYTATFVADDATVAEETVAYGSALPEVAVPEKTGYTGAWDYTGTMPAKNITIKAVYTPIPYTITWVYGDNTVTEEQWNYDTTPVFGYSTDKTSSATTDYTFVGWQPEITKVTGDAKYEAVYTESARKYTVTYEADGVTVGTQEVANGEKIELIEFYKKTGYTGVWGGVPEVMPTHDVVITAVYTPIPYKITWVTPDGSVTETWDYDSMPVYSGETPTKEPTAEKVYAFSGWSPEVTTVTGDATYEAQFTDEWRKYTVTYIVDGKILETREFAVGDPLDNPEIPAREGYSAKWNTTYTTMPAQDLTVSAAYTARKYVIYWRADGVTVYTGTYTYGQMIPIRDVPEKPGHTGEWNCEYTTVPAHNIYIDAVYTVNSYTLTYRVAGETGSETVTYGVDYERTFHGELPEALRVAVNGKPISNFTYDNTTRLCQIPGTEIVGNIMITERAAAGYNNVYVTVDGGEGTNKAEITKDGMAYHTQIVPNEGYLIPETIEVYIDGTRLTEGYTYDSDTGKLTVNGEVMYGELELKVSCPVDPDYVADPEPEPEPDEGHEGLFGWLLDFFTEILNFFRRIFGIA